MRISVAIKYMLSEGFSEEIISGVACDKAEENEPPTRLFYIIPALVNAGTPIKALLACAELIEAEDCRDRAESELPTDWRRRRLLVFDRDNWTCVYCGASTDHPHCDHIIPISRGGSSEMDNLTTACAQCNVAKRDRTPEEWRVACR